MRISTMLLPVFPCKKLVSVPHMQTTNHTETNVYYCNDNYFLVKLCLPQLAMSLRRSGMSESHQEEGWKIYGSNRKEPKMLAGAWGSLGGTRMSPGGSA